MQPKPAILTTAVLALSGSTFAVQGSQTSSALTPVETCLNACAPANVDCKAACVGTAHPDPKQANATTQCIRNTCHQGDGSAAATEAYSQCVQGCIEMNFPTSQSGVPTVILPTPTVMMTSVTPTVTGKKSSSSSGSRSKSSSGSTGSHYGSSGSGSGKPASSSKPGSGSAKPTSGSKPGSGSAKPASVLGTSGGKNAASSHFKTGASFAAIAAIVVAAFIL